MLVRGLMFPLGRKQALAAQKMQALQPHLKAIQEKYKDDKERLTKETFALYKKYGVNPMGGCLPALIQLPIFVGLWQALNTSVPLRHATVPLDPRPGRARHAVPVPHRRPVPGRTWFNLLPFVVVGLMLVQTQLFSPPATTPEAEQSQKMMKYMMIFMGVMFYKVPSGLGIYFITSSLWAIGERLLLPKLTHAELTPVAARPTDAEQDEDRPAATATATAAVRRAARALRGQRRAASVRGGSPSSGSASSRRRRRTRPTARAARSAEPRGRDKEKGDPRPRPRRR